MLGIIYAQCINVSKYTHTPDALYVHPTYGSVLGGDIITIQGCLSGQTITCDFDGVERTATAISAFEVVCVTPPLRRVGGVVVRMRVDGVAAGEIPFTSGELPVL